MLSNQIEFKTYSTIVFHCASLQAFNSNVWIFNKKNNPLLITK